MNEAERIRRLLAERLGCIGVAPDLRNDGPAVRAVAAQVGQPLEVVVDQLVSMRSEQHLNMARRLGQASLSPGALTLLAASRDYLLDGQPFEQAFQARAQQGPQELARSLGQTLPRPRAVAA